MRRIRRALALAALLALVPPHAFPDDPPPAPKDDAAVAEAMKRKRIELDNRRLDLPATAAGAMKLLDEFRAKDFRVWSRARAKVVGEGKNALPALLIALDETDWEVRALAGACLGDIKDPSAAGPLATAYAKEETFVEARRQYLLALVAILAPESKDLMVKAAADKDAGIRLAAARGIAAYEDPQLKGALIRLAVDPNLDVKYEALGGLAALKEPTVVKSLREEAKALVADGDDARVISRKGEDDSERYTQYLLGLTLARAGADKFVNLMLAEILMAEKPWAMKSFLRIGVAEGLGRVSQGKPKLDFRITAGIAARSEAARIVCSYAAGSVGSPYLLTPLGTALNDAVMDVRFNAVRAIGGIGGDAAVKLLEKAMKDSAGEVRVGAVRSLAGIHLPSATKVRVDALKDEKYVLRVLAVRTLAHRTSEEGVIAALTHATKDPDYGVRAQALAALAHHPDGAAVLPAILGALDDADYGVRTNACLALAALPGAAAAADPAVGAKVVSVYLGAREPKLVRGADEALDAVRFASAVPPLLDALGNESVDVRRRANLALQKMTETGKNFNPDGDLGDRNEAIKRWRDWWSKAEGKLPPRGARARAAVTGRLAEVAKDLKWKGLDIALLFDSTLTMKDLINEAKQRVEEIATELHDLMPSLRVSVFTYRDHNCEYLYYGTPLTYDTWKLPAFLQDAKADQGGDAPEAVFEVVAAACDRLDWRPGAHKVVAYVGDAMNHDETNDKFMAKVKEFFTPKNEAVLHALYTGQGRRSLDIKARTERDDGSRLAKDKVFESFKSSAEAGRGQAILLDDGSALIKELLVLTFGETFRPDVENLLDFER